MRETFILLLILFETNGLKTWIPNTSVNNSLNWDFGDTPKNCDNLLFPQNSEIAADWNIKEIEIAGLTLPWTGEILFNHNIKIEFTDKKKCHNTRELAFTRSRTKGWLDPDNWKSDTKFTWLPHSESVPCAGESINFPSGQTFAVQLPSILLPFRGIFFGNDFFQGEDWQRFLKTEKGFQLFNGPEGLRNLPWRTENDCSGGKKCVCVRSAYAIRDGLYKEVNSRTFEEAVCLYAMPRCKSSPCYAPIVPEGHCCGICGSIIKLEDNTKEGVNIDQVISKVNEELGKYEFKKILKTYVGRTRDGNIQIVIVASNSDDTIKSHTISNIIKMKLKDQYLMKVTCHQSGLTFKKYIFNNVSGIVFGTLLGVLILFGSIYYLYIVLPKKKFNYWKDRAFVFSRFDNSGNEDNGEDNLGVDHLTGPIQAFDNPIYSETSNPSEGEVDENEKDNREQVDKNLEKRIPDYLGSDLDSVQSSENIYLVPEDEKTIEEFREIKL